MSRYLIPLVAAVVAVAGVAPGTAEAVSSPRGSVTNPVGMCQGALPSYEGKLRKRPLAIANEGTTSAFISCAFTGEDYSVDGTNAVYLYFRNPSGTATATVSCTLVDNYDGANGGVYVSKSVSVPVGPGFAEIVYDANDNNGNNFDRIVSFSCNLPAGVAIIDSFHYYDIDVGQ